MLPPMLGPSGLPMGAFGALKARIENPVLDQMPWFPPEMELGAPAMMGPPMDPMMAPEMAPPGLPANPMGTLPEGDFAPPPSPDPMAMNGDFDRRQQLKDDMVMLLAQKARARGQATDKFQRYSQAAAKQSGSGGML